MSENIIINDYFTLKQTLEEKNKKLEERIKILENLNTKTNFNYEKVKIVYTICLFIFYHKIISNPFLLVKCIKIIFTKIF